MMNQISVSRNTNKCRSYGQKNLEKSHFLAILPFFDGFLAITPAFLNILRNRFLIHHQGLKALLLVYNTTIFEKIIFFDLYMWSRKTLRVIFLPLKIFSQSIFCGFSKWLSMTDQDLAVALCNWKTWIKKQASIQPRVIPWPAALQRLEQD